MSNMSDPEFVLTTEIPHWAGLDPMHREGLCGATFGNLAVSTPNASVMYMPIFGHERTLYLRKDFRFGVDDSMTHPQIYIPELAHLACQPAPSFEPDVAYLFQPFQDEWWEPLAGFTGIVGKIKTSAIMPFKIAARTFAREVETIKQNVEDGHYPGVTPAMFNTPDLRNALYWQKTSWIQFSKAGTLVDIKFRFVNAQRHELNLRGLIKIQLQYRYRLRTASSIRHTVNNQLMGAMTTNFSTAQMLYFAGIPVWYIYDAKVANPANFKRYFSSDEVNNIREATEITPRVYQMGYYLGNHPDLAFITGGKQPFISRARLPDSIELWRGPAGHPQRYRVMSTIIKRTKDYRSQHAAVTSTAGSFSSSPRQESMELDVLDSAAPMPVSANVQISQPMASTSTSAAPSMASTMSVSTSSSSNALKRSADSAFLTPAPGTANLQEGDSQGSVQARPMKKKPKKKKTTKKDAAAADKPVQKDRSRFDDVVNDFMPYSVPSCQQALARVAQDVKLTGHEIPKFPGVKKLHALYILPEAVMLAGLENAKTRTLYLVNLVRLLPLFESRILDIEDPKEEINHASGRSWRLILAGFEKDFKGQTRSAERRAGIVEALRGILETSNIPASSLDLLKLSSVPAIWNGVEIADVNTPNEELEDLHTEVAREIIWYCNEVNWRMELLQLDSFLFVPSAWSNRQTSEERRASMIQGIRHWNNCVLPTEMDGDNTLGFTSNLPHERYGACLNLMDLMKSWTGAGLWCELPERLVELDKTLYKRNRTRSVIPAPDELRDFEEWLWEHYIRTFIHVFARVPTLPRALDVGRFRG